MVSCFLFLVREQARSYSDGDRLSVDASIADPQIQFQIGAQLDARIPGEFFCQIALRVVHVTEEHRPMALPIAGLGAGGYAPAAFVDAVHTIKARYAEAAAERATKPPPAKRTCSGGAGAGVSTAPSGDTNVPGTTKHVPHLPQRTFFPRTFPGT